LYRKWIKNHNVNDLLNYKNYLKIYKAVVKQCEDDYYKNVFTKCANNTKQVWQEINKIFSVSKANRKNKSFINKIIIDNKTLTDTTNICNALNDYFCNVGEKIATYVGPCTISFKKYLNNNICKSVFLEPICRQELLNTINELNLHKSAGPDEIGPKIIQDCKNRLINPLLFIFNLSFETGVFPSSLKIAKVIPIYKKGEKTSTGNYRPISMLSIFDKILEKLMYRRIYNFLIKNNILFKYQFGFRKGHSTTLALIEITDELYKKMDENYYSMGIFLDLQKAFDSVNHSILLEKLYNVGIRGPAYKWFSSYLSNRKQYVTIGGIKSEICNINCGVPQGSVLGPLLFLVYVNDLQNSAPNTSIKLFADDTNVFLFQKNIDALYASANEALQQMNDWLKSNKLCVNVEKTQYIIFKKSNFVQTCDSHLSLHMNGKQILKVRSCKYLGITLDDKLSFIEHIDNLVAKIRKYCGIF
ncbi:MAG: reverse transcriptase domain-containing protein, partial [Oscillospiraceae bacterium]